MGLIQDANGNYVWDTGVDTTFANTDLAKYAGLGPSITNAKKMDTTGVNPLDTTVTTDNGLMNFMNTNAKGIGTGLQAIGLGASLYDSFWGDSAKMNKKNMQLLDQQIASNADTIANTKAVRKAWADTERTV